MSIQTWQFLHVIIKMFELEFELINNRLESISLPNDIAADFFVIKRSFHAIISESTCT